MSKMQKGRPKGSPNKAYSASTAKPSRCRCGSTRRTRYYSTVIQEIAGLDADGNPYTHLIRRRTSCADCGQFRIDRFYENWPDGPPEDLADEPEEEPHATDEC